jgi:hypothetical protein
VDDSEILPPSSPTGDFEFSLNNRFDSNESHNGFNRSNNHPSASSHINSTHGHTLSNKSTMNTSFNTDIDFNDTPTLNQQPLALGFYVSTIGTLNPLPSWMTQNNRHQQQQQRSLKSSSVFRANLHISIPNVQPSDDNLLNPSHDQNLAHPLDSNYTYVVLRYDVCSPSLIDEEIKRERCFQTCFGSLSSSILACD